MSRKKAEKREEGGFAKWLAWTIALGLVFSAGLITGQRLLRREALPPMVSLSSTRVAADEPKVAEEPPLRTTFSFYEHLTADTPAVAAEPASPPPEVAVAASKPEVVPTPAPKVDDAEKAPENAPAIEEAVEAAPPNNQAEGEPPSTVGEAAAALQKVVDTFKSEEPDAAALPARYTLQVSSHPDRDSAEREMSRLEGAGVEPYILAVDVPGKGKLYRIRVGKFHSMDEARNFQGSLKQKRGVAGFVTPL